MNDIGQAGAAPRPPPSPAPTAASTSRSKSNMTAIRDTPHHQEYDRFRPRLWSDACIELRLIAARLCMRSENLRAAMILAFVAAVEQNLLGLRCVRGPADGVAASLTLPPITQHLTRYLE